jgi:hypothetical protein
MYGKQKIMEEVAVVYMTSTFDGISSASIRTTCLVNAVQMRYCLANFLSLFLGRNIFIVAKSTILQGKVLLMSEFWPENRRSTFCGNGGTNV